MLQPKLQWNVSAFKMAWRFSNPELVNIVSADSKYYRQCVIFWAGIIGVEEYKLNPFYI